MYVTLKALLNVYCEYAKPHGIKYFSSAQRQ